MLNCPPIDEYRSLAEGKLSPARAESLLQHLDGCPLCADSVSDLDCELADTNWSRTPPLIGPEHDDTISDVIVRGRSLWKDRSLARLMLPPPADADEISHIGRYRVLELLGEGGFGAVFRAEDTYLRRRVAIKVLKPFAAADDDLRERFLHEARSAASVVCDHVVRVYEADEIDGVPFLVMELLDGEPLGGRLRRPPPLTPEEVRAIGRDLAAGLEAVHSCGLIHRDVKPNNVWLRSDGRAMLLDFGLALSVDRSSRRTTTGAMMGTPGYMAPEQAHGRPVDGRSDLFSLGSVLYECLAGRPAFPGSDPASVMWAVVSRTPPSPRRLNPAVPEDLSRAVMRLLAKLPEHRPSSAAVAAEELSGKLPPDPSRRRWLMAAGAGVVAGVGTLAWWSRPAPDWLTLARTLPPGPRVDAVCQQLRRLNPDFAGIPQPTIRDGRIVEFKLTNPQLTDIRPLAALTDLQSLTLHGDPEKPTFSPLADLSPLAGLPIVSLSLRDHCRITDLAFARTLPKLRVLRVYNCGTRDLSPLTGLPLAALEVGGAAAIVSDLSPLRGMPLIHLAVNDSEVEDLSPLHGMKLQALQIAATRVSDLSPLRGMPLVWVQAHRTRVRDVSPLIGCPLKRLTTDLPDDRVREVLGFVPEFSLTDPFFKLRYFGAEPPTE